MASQQDRRAMDQAFALLHARAVEAGLKAAAPIPDRGACGFGWVNIRGGTAFANWLRDRSGKVAPKGTDHKPLTLEARARADADGGKWGRDSYAGGYTLWVWVGGQSVDAKHAYAMAFANVLKEGGVPATAHSRLD